MEFHTLGEARVQIAPVAGNTGLPVTGDLLADYINKAVRELANEGDWPGVVDRWYLRYDVASGLVALPYQLERLIAVCVDDVPLEMRSPWFEFCQYGPGVIRDAGVDSQGNVLPARIDWTDVVTDRGESPVRIDIPVDGGPWRMRVEALVEEAAGETVRFFGLDPDGHFVRSEVGGVWGNGETVAITSGTGGSVTDGAKDFSALTAVTKTLTNGTVKISAANSTGVVVELATYEYNETTPSFRRYFIPALYREKTGERDRVILGRCRRRFVPATDDSQVLMIGNLDALEEMVIAQYKRSIGSFDEYTGHKGTAVDLMKKDALAHSGKSKVPGMTFRRGFWIGEVPFLR